MHQKKLIKQNKEINNHLMDLENKNSQLETQLNQCQNKLNEIQSLNTCYNARIDIL